MACGAPVITSAIGGLEEFVRDGETGLLVDPGDVESLAAHIVRLSVDRQLAESLSARARRFVTETLSWDAVVRELRERIYPPLLRQSAGVAG
jgi:glycosyltransferase involved in cell wall biosynthesis